MLIPGLSFQLDEAAIPWVSTGAPGVYWFPLHLEAPAGGFSGQGVDPDDATVLIRIEPGCVYPPHHHRGIEEVLVLQGGYTDDEGSYTEGTYVRYPAGTIHAPRAIGNPEAPPGENNPACVLYAVARGGVELVT